MVSVLSANVLSIHEPERLKGAKRLGRRLSLAVVVAESASLLLNSPRVNPLLRLPGDPGTYRFRSVSAVLSDVN